MQYIVVVEEVYDHIYRVDADNPDAAADAVLEDTEDINDMGSKFSYSHRIRVFDAADVDRKNCLFEDVIVGDVDVPEEADACRS